MNAPNVNHFTIHMVQAVEGGGIGTNDAIGKLLCFDADGVTVFQGTRYEVLSTTASKKCSIHKRCVLCSP